VDRHQASGVRLQVMVFSLIFVAAHGSRRTVHGKNLFLMVSFDHSPCAFFLFYLYPFSFDLESFSFDLFQPAACRGILLIFKLNFKNIHDKLKLCFNDG
jgi:hypothetical protein